MSGVKDTDRGYQKLVRRIFTFGGPKISVGIHESDGKVQHGEMRVIDIANIHEFGLGNVPQRSFIRAWFDENQERARAAMQRLLRSVVKGDRTPEQAVDTFALWVVGQMQLRMAKGIAPPLKRRTILRKGSSVPLIDTGQLRTSISYKVFDENFTLKREGISKAAAKRAKAALRDKKAAERKEAKRRERQKKAVVKAFVKGAKTLKRNAKKVVRTGTRTLKDGVRVVKKVKRSITKKRR